MKEIVVKLNKVYQVKLKSVLNRLLELEAGDYVGFDETDAGWRLFKTVQTSDKCRSKVGPDGRFSVPEAVRESLGVGAGSAVAFVLRGEANLTVKKAE